MKADFHIEMESISVAKDGETCCGDVFSSRKVTDENRIIGVLSNGAGTGIKANIIANMTVTMAIQFAINHEPAQRTANFIINTLPHSNNTKECHATFSMVDINYRGEVNLVEYGNPGVIFLKGKKAKAVTYTPLTQLKRRNNKEILHSNFKLTKEDRLIIFTNGILQTFKRQLHEDVEFDLIKFIENIIREQPSISAKQLVKKIVMRAQQNNGGKFGEDATCCVVYCRQPRQLIIATGPPYHKQHDKYLAEVMHSFNGKRVICGGTTAQIIAREVNESIHVSLETADTSLPPTSEINGFDLVTEGILTLGKVLGYLENSIVNNLTTNGPAEKLTRMLLNSDEITFMLGTRVNEAHQDPNLPVELEIRRNVIKKMAQILDEKFLKTTTINYL